MKKINWEEIQKYYNDNHTWRDIQNNFNITSYLISKAIQEKKLKIRNRSEANKLANKLNPRKLSEETKNKISKSRKKYLEENPDKVPYLLNHYSKGSSYPEKYFDKIFDGKIEYERYLQVGLYHIDFAIINKNIAIEIDGEQHYLDKKIIESDKRKNKYLKDKGWDLIRIRWSEYQKMKRKEKEKYVKELLNYIENSIEKKPIIEYEKKTQKNKEKKKYYCECGNEIYKGSVKCVKCSHIEQRKVENIPTKEELLKLIKETSYESIARKYKVSSNSIRKWLK